MNNTINIKRFGNYLVHDLRNAWRTCGLSGLTVAASPLLMIATVCLLSLIGTGSIPEFDNSISLFPTLYLAIFIIITAPVKMYGGLTERRVGSDWTLLPASPAEKTASMVIMSGIVVPVLCVVSFIGFQYLTELLIPGYDVSYAGPASLMGDKGVMAVMFNTVMVNALWFLLGAIWFKTAKKSKTILALFVLSGIIFIIVFLFLSHLDSASGHGLMGVMINSMEKWEPDQALSFFKWLGVAFNVLEVAVIAGLCFWRVKTIQH